MGRSPARSDGPGPLPAVIGGVVAVVVLWWLVGIVIGTVIWLVKLAVIVGVVWGVLRVWAAFQRD